MSDGHRPAAPDGTAVEAVRSIPAVGPDDSAAGADGQSAAPDATAAEPATSTAAGPEVINVEAVTGWFAEHVPAARPPLAFELVEAGHSNMTFVVADSGGRRWVLRRPPLHNVLATAHDMGREHRVIAALHPEGFPVPAPLGLCTDAAVNGATFYVMEYVDGLVLRDATMAAAGLTIPARRAVSRQLVEVLARLHRIDVDAVGLGDLGRREGYVARQLRRWLGQVEAIEAEQATQTTSASEHTQRASTTGTTATPGIKSIQATDPTTTGTTAQPRPETGPGVRAQPRPDIGPQVKIRPEIRAVHDRLVARIPDQATTGIVHGDFRLDNCIVSPSGEIRAVLDWELCTLGDVLADVAMLLTYWSEPGEETQALQDAPTALDGFYNRQELLDAYAAAAASGRERERERERGQGRGRGPGRERDLEHIDFYLSWAAWRLACILLGVEARYRAGAMGHKEPPEGIHSFAGRIDGLLARATHHAARLP